MSALKDRELEAVFFGPGRTPGVCAMLFGYFDESGTDGDAHHVVIAGFLGHLNDWLEIMPTWRRELDRVGVNPFHRVECKGRNGRYYGWTREQSKRHIDKLASIAESSSLLPISASFNGTWRNIPMSKPERGRFLHPYHVCFELLVGNIISLSQSRWPGQPIAMVMERQDQFSTRAQQIYDIFKYNNRWSSIKHFSYADKGDCDYLQLADLIAWEIRRYFWADLHDKKVQADFPLIGHLMARPDFEDGYLGNFLTNEGVRLALDMPGPHLEFPPGLIIGSGA